MTELIDGLKKMPGVGPKSAERMAFHILRLPHSEAKALAYSILRVKETIRFCNICGNLSEQENCHICTNPNRDREIVCVVQQPKDIISIEKAAVFRGVYHVLGGALSPLDGVGPENLRISELIERTKQIVKEIIIATDSDSEGETTFLYLTKLLRGAPVKVTRIAYGLPMGSNLEYADQVTIAKALQDRRVV